MTNAMSSVLLVLSASALPAYSQATQLDDGYRRMYNLEFDAAHVLFNEWERAHPEDPLGPVSDAAAYLFAEFDRLHILQSELFVHNESFLGHAKPTPDPSVKLKFEAALSRSRALADKTLARAPQDDNALFATVMRCGLHADYLALIEKRYLASLSEVKTGRDIAEQLLARNAAYYDAYLAIGVENYMLSLKPAPVRWLLRLGGARTDKEEGIRTLKLTAEKGRYLLPYARLLLAVAALRDNDRGGARSLLAYLSREFPRNPLYAEELSKLK